MKNFHFILFFSLLNLQLIFSQSNPVQWSFSSNELSDGMYELVFTADVQEGWSIYSQHTDPSGPIPTAFYFDNNSNIELLDKPSEAGKKKEGYDELFGVNVIKFAGKVTFIQKIKMIEPTKNVVGYLEYMCCDEEKCLPPKEVAFTIPLP